MGGVLVVGLAVGNPRLALDVGGDGRFCTRIAHRQRNGAQPRRQQHETTTALRYAVLQA